MTTTIAFTGKSGSGKTSVLRALLELLQESYSDKTFLLVDSDLSLELGLSLGYDIRNTIYGIRSGKHQYQANVEDISQQEFVDWALEDIVEPVSDNIDMIVTWLLGSKDCRCPITSDIRNGFKKLINCRPLLLLPSVFPSIRGFSSESVFPIRGPKNWSFSFSISPSNEYSGFPLGLTGLISLLSKVLSSLLQHNLKASIIWLSAFF